MKPPSLGFRILVLVLRLGMFGCIFAMVVWLLATLGWWQNEGLGEEWVGDWWFPVTLTIFFGLYWVAIRIFFFLRGLPERVRQWNADCAEYAELLRSEQGLDNGGTPKTDVDDPKDENRSA
jgi:hypothetical protein